MSTSGQIGRSISRFKDYAGNFARSNSSNFENNLAIFLNFIETDPVFSDIHRQLLSVEGVDFDSWYEASRQTGGSMVGSCELRLPVDPEKRMSLVYQILRRIEKNDPDLLNFSLLFFSTNGGRVDGLYREFSESFTKPFLDEMKHRLDDVLESLPPEPRAEVPPTMVTIIQHANNVLNQTAVGNNNIQTAHQSNTELERNFDGLAAELKSGLQDAAVLKEQLEIVEAARALATAPSPKRSVVSALLASLEPIGQVASLTTTILGLLG